MDTAEKTMQEGYTLVQSGSHEEALEAFLRAEALYAAAGDGQRQARACTNKALVLVQLRRFADALDGFRAALGLFEKSDEFIRVAEQYGNIGSVHRDLGQPRRSKATRRRSRSIASSGCVSARQTSARTSPTPGS